MVTDERRTTNKETARNETKSVAFFLPLDLGLVSAFPISNHPLLSFQEPNSICWCRNMAIAAHTTVQSYSAAAVVLTVVSTVTRK
jgi:hypothetical protein